MNSVDFGELFNKITQVKKIVDFEYRLYYNKETNKPLFYTMEKPNGDYIIVTHQQYSEGRHDIIIVDGNIKSLANAVSWSKLVPSDSGTGCRANNVMIVDAESDKKWKLKTYYQNQ